VTRRSARGTSIRPIQRCLGFRREEARVNHPSVDTAGYRQRCGLPPAFQCQSSAKRMFLIAYYCSRF
jgi:hypothetical protein